MTLHDFAYSTFRLDRETLTEFAQAGVRSICFRPSNTLCSLGVPYSPYPKIWEGPGMYNWDALEAQIADITAAVPDARLLCQIDLNTPDWWVRVNGHYSRQVDSFYELGRIAASAKWRSDTRDFLLAFLRYCEEKHPNRMAAYMLQGGCTTEWQDHSAGQESASKRQGWRQWMLDRGKADPIDIPPESVRLHTTHGYLRDPQTDGMALDYWRYSHWLVGDTIQYFCEAAQEVLRHRVPLGVFYGYVLEHGTGRLVWEGHLDYDRLYRCDAIDFFMSPGTYADRQSGGASGFMVCMDSLKLHGKGFYHEVDHLTHTSSCACILGRNIPGREAGFADEATTVAALQRECALALCKGISIWWFDMFGSWFKGDRVMGLIARMNRIWEEYGPAAGESVSEVAMLVDAPSIVYLDGNALAVSDFYARQRAGLGRLGAPYDIYSTADLAAVDWSRYKLILIPILYELDEARRALLAQHLLGGGRTIVWVDAPGIMNSGRYDPAAVEALTGIRHSLDHLATHDFGTWRSVLAPKPNLDAETLRQLARDAGVHLYTDSGEPVYACATLLALHSATGGRRTLRLPRACRRVTELVTGQVVAENVAAFEDTYQAPDTRLYRLQW